MGMYIKRDIVKKKKKEALNALFPVLGNEVATRSSFVKSQKLKPSVSGTGACALSVDFLSVSLSGWSLWLWSPAHSLLLTRHASTLQ